MLRKHRSHKARGTGNEVNLCCADLMDKDYCPRLSSQASAKEGPPATDKMNKRRWIRATMIVTFRFHDRRKEATAVLCRCHISVRTLHPAHDNEGLVPLSGDREGPRSNGTSLPLLHTQTTECLEWRSVTELGVGPTNPNARVCAPSRNIESTLPKRHFQLLYNARLPDFAEGDALRQVEA